MSNNKQQMHMTNHLNDHVIDAAGEENTEVLSSVVDGSRSHEMITTHSIVKSKRADRCLVTLLAAPKKHKPALRTRYHTNRTGQVATISTVWQSTGSSTSGARIAVNNPDIPAEIPATQAGDSQLPCRGCTRNCSRYGRCNHTPWRSAELSRMRAFQYTDSTECTTLVNACSVA